MSAVWAEKGGGDFVEISKDTALVGPGNYYNMVERAEGLVTALSRGAPRADLSTLLKRSAVSMLVAMDRIPLNSIGLAREARSIADIEHSSRP